MAKLTLNLADIQAGHLPRICIYTGSLKHVHLQPLRVPGRARTALRLTQLAVAGALLRSTWGPLGRSSLYLSLASSALVAGLWRVVGVPAYDQTELRLPASEEGMASAGRIHQMDPWMQLLGGGFFSLALAAFIFEGPLQQAGGVASMGVLAVMTILFMAGALVWLSQRRESTIKLLEQTPGTVLLEVPTAVERAYRNAFAIPKVEPALPEASPQPGVPRDLDDRSSAAVSGGARNPSRDD